MLESIIASFASRRRARHQVELPCELITRYDEVPRLVWATDLSCDGAWIEMDRPLRTGEHVVISFRPGIWWRAAEITVFAEVARRSLGRRAFEPGAGLGLTFLDLEPAQRWALRRWLSARPVAVPHRRLGPQHRVQRISDGSLSPEVFRSAARWLSAARAVASCAG